ncbi:MAG: hypothetical protein LBL80_04200 [Ruminococcus sp.]|jgi:hypothetical protein|nr:hypothetical protein [Ruminococcus sp.]
MTKNKYGIKMALLTVLLALPGLTLLIVRFVSDRLGGIGWLRFAAMLMCEIGSDIITAFAVMSFCFMIKFISENPSYKNYSTKSNVSYAKFVTLFGAVCYIIKLLFYIFKAGEISISTTYSLLIFGMIFQIFLYSIILSDKNLYIGQSWQTYSVNKIKLDNYDEIQKANIRHEDYLDLRFHYDEKEVKARIKRTEMSELLEIIKGKRNENKN